MEFKLLSLLTVNRLNYSISLSETYGSNYIIIIKNDGNFNNSSCYNINFHWKRLQKENDLDN